MTVTRTVARYHTVRDTTRLTDTVWVKQMIAQGDSVVRACTALQSSCALFRVRADSVIADLTTERDALRAALPKPPGKIRSVFLHLKDPALFVAGVWVGSKVGR